MLTGVNPLLLKGRQIDAFDPLKKGSVTLLNENTAMAPTASGEAALTVLAATAKVIIEFVVTTLAGQAYIGFATSAVNLNGYIGLDNNGFGLSSVTGQVQKNGSSFQTLAGFAQGDVISVILDVPNNIVWFAKNGVLISSGSPATGSGGLSFSSLGTVYFGASCDSGDVITIRRNAYSLYSGFAAFNP